MHRKLKNPYLRNRVKLLPSALKFQKHTGDKLIIEQEPKPRIFHAHNRTPQRDHPRCPGCGAICLDVATLTIHQHFCQRYRDLHAPTPKPEPKKPPAQKTKICTKCNIEKPLTDFPSDKQKPDGVKGQCRECTNAYLRGRYAKMSQAI